MSPLVFLSYARENEDRVAEVEMRVRRLGFNVWFDQELHGGQAWWEEILRQIRRCDALIAVISTASLESRACSRERQYAADLGKPVVPVAVEDVSTALPTDLVSRQIVDYTPGNPESAFMLASALAGLPHDVPLPDPLPPEPEIPLSYLARLVDLADLPRDLTRREQLDLLDDLEPGLRATDPDEREGAWRVLRHVEARPDLYLDTSRRIERFRLDYADKELRTGRLPATDAEALAGTAAATAGTPTPVPPPGAPEWTSMGATPAEREDHRPVEPAAPAGTVEPAAPAGEGEGRGRGPGPPAAAVVFAPLAHPPARHPPEHEAGPQTRTRRRRSRVALLVLVLVVAAGAVWWALTRGVTTEPPVVERQISLGEVTVGDPQSSVVAVDLAGAAAPFDLAVTDAGPFAFELSPTCNDSPGDCTVTVTFTPTAEGAATATATITGATGRTVAELTASGTGIAVTAGPAAPTDSAPNLKVFTLESESSELVVGAAESRIVRVWNKPGEGVGPSQGSTLVVVLGGDASVAGATDGCDTTETDATCRIGQLSVGGTQDVVLTIVAGRPSSVTLAMQITPDEDASPGSGSWTYTAVQRPTQPPTTPPSPRVTETADIL